MFVWLNWPCFEILLFIFCWVCFPNSTWLMGESCRAASQRVVQCGAEQPSPSPSRSGGRIIFQRLLHQLKPSLNFTPNFWRADALCAGPSWGLPFGTPPRMLWAGSGLPARHRLCLGTSFFSSVTQADSLLLIHSGQGTRAVVSSSLRVLVWWIRQQKVASRSGCEQRRVL